VSHHRVTDVGPVPGHDVEDARRESGLLVKFRDEQAARDGVFVAGLRTTALPAATAGPTARPDRFSGKFHGEMTVTTPWGPA